MKKNNKQWFAIGIIITGLLLINRKVVLAYFKLSEFDSPDLPGSGGNMRASTLKKLDKARGYAGIPFVVPSGYRTESHNAEVDGVENSSHTKGYAADIATTPENQKLIVQSLVKAGFNRIGIGINFVHVDDDPAKNPYRSWGYPYPSPAPYDPFTL